MATYADAYMEDDVSQACALTREGLSEMVLTICEGAVCEDGNRITFSRPVDLQDAPREACVEYAGIFLNHEEDAALRRLGMALYQRSGRVGDESDFIVHADVLMPRSATLRAALLKTRLERINRLKAFCGAILPEIPAERTGSESEFWP